MKSPLSVLRRLPAVILLVLTALAGLDLSADRLTARQAFMLMPDSIVDLLPASTRKLMVDSFRTEPSFEATNALGGKSKLERLDSTYAFVMLTSVSNIQIKVLPRGATDCIVGMSYTVCGPEPDSELFFFDSAMRPIAVKKIFKIPVMRDYFEPIDKAQLNEIDNVMPFPTATYHFTSDNNTLTATLTSCAMLPRETRDSIALLLTAPLKYEWSNGKYKPLLRR